MGQIETILTPYKLTPPSPDYIQPASFTSRLLRPTAIPVLDLLAKLHGVGQPLVWRVVEVGVMGIGLANTGIPLGRGFRDFSSLASFSESASCGCPDCCCRKGGCKMINSGLYVHFVMSEGG